MMMRLYPLAVAMFVLSSACGDYPSQPDNAPAPMSAQRAVGEDGSSEIVVMTQNLYVGADVDLVIHALATPDPGDDFPALLSAIETLGKTDFPVRAAAIAAEIARTRPQAVGLQEVSQINIDLRPLGVPVTVDQDFLVILQAALAATDRVVLMGDLNDTPGSPMYAVLGRAGFTDVWSALREGEDGNTCCHVADLSDPVSNFSERIDYVFARGLQRRSGDLSGEIRRFGVATRDRLAGPASLIWPSDHAGLVAELEARRLH